MSEKKRTIMLGFHSSVDGRLMREWVKGLGYDVVESLDDTAGIDLVLMDSTSARRLMEKAFGLKRKAKYFLPVLVCINAGEDVGRWLKAGFDDVLRLPATKGEWQVRIEIMLRLRRQSEDLGQKSEYLHRALIESSGDHIFLLDASGAYVTSNDRVDHVGLDRGAQLVGKTIEQVYPKEVAPFYRTQLQRVLTEGKTVVFEHDLPSDQGTYHHLDTLYPVKLPDGAVMVGGICRDISERKLVEKALRESEEKFRKAFSTSPDSININRLDDGMFISVNHGFTKITGYSESDVIGKTSLEINIWVNPGDREKLAEGLRKHGQVQSFEAQFRMKDGKVVYGLMSAAVITLDGVPHIISIARDITVRKQAEEALRESRERLNHLFTVTPAVVYELDPENFSPTWVSPNITEITGHTPEETRQAGWWTGHVHPDDREETKKAQERLMGEDRLAHEYRFEKKDGTYIWVRDEFLLFRDKQGTPKEIVGSWMNITDRKEAEIESAKSEQRYRSVFENTGTAMIIITKDGAIVFANKQCAATTGYSPEELQGTDWRRYVFADDLPMMENYFRLRFSDPDKAPKRYETRLIHADGSIRNCLLTVDAIPAAGQVVVSMLDVTDRVRAEEARRVLETAIGEAQECIMVSDRENRLTYVNRAFEKLTGYSAAEVFGNTPGILKSGQHDRKFYQNLKKTIYAGHPWDGNLTLKKKNGDLYEVYATITPVLDESGTQKHFVSVHRDVTEEREREKRFQQNQRLEAIGTLAGGIAHDFNNLLTPILGFTDLSIWALPPGNKTKDYLEQVQLAANRAKELVQQILSFSRRSTRERKPLRMAPIVKETLKLLRASIPSTIDIKEEIYATTEMAVADPTEIHQVMMNLCTNAYQAMPDGGVLTVTLKTIDLDSDTVAIIPNCKPGRHLKLSVEDTGQGISPEIRDKIFEPYFTTKEEGRGTGLGLAVTHSIVAASAGGITVHSESGNGTRFNVYLPVAEASPTDAVEKRAGIRSGHERILFVDDEPAIVELGQKMLERYGYSVTTCMDPVQALELFKKAPADFDMVITDMTMPGMTGDLLTDALLKIRPDLLVIVCTGFSERMNEQKAQKMGIRRLLDKPVAAGTLLATIREIFDREE